MDIREVLDERGNRIKVLYSINDSDLTNGTFEIPADVEAIGNSAFKSCQKLTDIIIPSNITRIEDKAFYGCTFLKSIIIPNSVKEIGKSAFEKCKSLTTVKLPEELKEIDDRTFSGCVSLSSIQITSDLERIGEEVFYNCTSIKKIRMPDSVKEIGESVFEKCKSLISIKLSSNLEEISDSAFSGCKNLSSIELPKNIRTIGYDCFEECESLKSITIPANVSEIKNMAFIDCKKMREINVESGNTSYKSIDGVLYDITGAELISYPSGKVDQKFVIPEGVKRIKERAFDGATKLRNIEIPDGVTEIGEGVFRKCENLKQIRIPETVRSLGEEAFSECLNLEDVELAGNISSIEWNTFFRCIKLKEIKIPDSVISVGESAFAGCKNLKRITVPSNLTHIEYNAFNTNSFVGGRSEPLYYDKGQLILDNPQGKNVVVYPANFLSCFGSIKELEEFYNNSDFKAFLSNFQNLDEIRNKKKESDFICFLKFAKVLGCFSKEKIRDSAGNETQVTVGQRASSILARLVKISPFDSDVYYRLFGELSFYAKANQGFLDFISVKEQSGYGNLRTLFILEKKYPGIFAKVMSNFDKASLYRNTIGDNGKTEIVPWDIALSRFYEGVKYVGVDKKDEDIADIYSEKGLKQSTFDKAVRLREVANQTKIPTHILGEPLKEDKPEATIPTGDSIKDNIKRIKMQTALSLKHSNELLEEMFDKKFFYEWLDKRDAHNSIIGLYCDCCATIESNDYGRDISRATIISPNVQNLVVRNLKDEIIAKCAVYVNSELGYAVVNNFEINKRYRRTQTKEPLGGRYTGDYKKWKDKTPAERKEDENRDLIFKTFVKGINDFVKRYNELHPDKPLHQVNVGTGYTKLKKQVEQLERANKKLSVPAIYSFFDAMRYDQYIIYKDKKEEKKEKER